MNGYSDEFEYYGNPEDILEEYEVNLREIILNAVNNKIKNKLEELETTRANLNIVNERNEKLRRTISTSEIKYKKDLDVALKEKEKEIEEKFGGGFMVNQTVYYVYCDPKITKCDTCSGSGKVEADVLGKMTKVPCPHCLYGKVYDYLYLPKKGLIRSIKLYITREQYNSSWCSGIGNIEIYMDSFDGSMRSEEVYKTIEECQVACDKKNKEEELRKAKEK